MAQVTDSSAVHEDLHARIVEVMKELKLPAPERMLGRIESMLPKGDRDRVLRQLLDDFRTQNPDEMKRVLKILAPNRDEWAREVERFIQAWRPAT